MQMGKSKSIQGKPQEGPKGKKEPLADAEAAKNSMRQWLLKEDSVPNIKKRDYATAVEWLKEFLTDPESKVRWGAAQALGSLALRDAKITPAIAALTERVMDESAEVRGKAIWVLEMAWYKGEDAVSEVAIEVLRKLGKEGKDVRSAFPLLKLIYENGKPEEIAVAESVLRIVMEQDMLNMMVDIFGHPC